MCKNNYETTDLKSVTWINTPRDTAFSTDKSYNNKLLNYIDQRQVVYCYSFFKHNRVISHDIPLFKVISLHQLKIAYINRFEEIA